MVGRMPKPMAVKKLEGDPGKRKLNSKEPKKGFGIRSNVVSRVYRPAYGSAGEETQERDLLER